MGCSLFLNTLLNCDVINNMRVGDKMSIDMSQNIFWHELC